MTTPMQATMLTLLDAAKRRDPDGKAAKIVELLNQTNDILPDMMWRAGNQTSGHRTTLRTSLPAAYFKLLNQGTLTSKSTTAQIEERCGKIETWSEIDCDLVDQEEDKAGFLLSESSPFLEALNEKMARYLFYGNANTEPESFTGLAPRYNAINGAGNAQNILSGGGTASANTSVWLVAWGQNTVHGIYPMATAGGLQQEDKGIKTIETAGGSAQGRRLDVYQTKWSWNCGLALRDWRGACRIANIDVNALTNFANQANLIELMVKAWHRVLPVMKLGKPAWYMNRTVAEMLDLQRLRVLGGTGSTGQAYLGGSIKEEELDGQMRFSFRGIPIRIVDQLTTNEGTIS